ETSSFNVASQVLDASHVAEAPPRLSLRFLRSHPALDVFPRSHQQVKAHLIVHLLLDPVLAQQSVDPRIDQPQPEHRSRSPQFVSMTLKTAPARRSQFSFSIWSCLRPAPVSL